MPCHSISLTSKSVFIAADDAIDTAVELYRQSKGRYFRSWVMDRSEVDKVDNKFRKALDLLSDFAEEFPLKDPTSDPKIGNNSKSPTTILQLLKNNLLSNVKFSSVSLSLNTDRY